MFYNAKVMAAAEVTGFPTDWAGFPAVRASRGAGITPIALGSNRWAEGAVTVVAVACAATLATGQEEEHGFRSLLQRA